MDTKRTVDNLWHIVEFDAFPYFNSLHSAYAAD
jgi:hypothetical protein